VAQIFNQVLLFLLCHLVLYVALIWVYSLEHGLIATLKSVFILISRSNHNLLALVTRRAFMEFWLVDVVAMPVGISAERGVAIHIAMLVIASLPSSWLSGWVSDRTGHRRGLVFVGMYAVVYHHDSPLPPC